MKDDNDNALKVFFKAINEDETVFDEYFGIKTVEDRITYLNSNHSISLEDANIIATKLKESDITDGKVAITIPRIDLAAAIADLGESPPIAKDDDVTAEPSEPASKDRPNDQTAVDRGHPG